MATERASANPTNNIGDKLTDISGLGKAAERDLHSIGIRRFDDLIPYTAEDLAERLAEQTRSQRYSAKYIRNNDWIGQAKRKVEERTRLQIPPAHGDTPETPEAQAARGRVEGWHRHAEFTLYFENRTAEQGGQTWQTRVWHTYIRGQECDEEETFEGLTPGPWVKWIFQQAGLADELDSELIEQRAVTPPAPAIPIPAQISILEVNVELKSPPDVRNKTLVASVRFTISGANVGTFPAETILYQVLILIVEQERHTPKIVASEYGLFQPNQAEYAHQLAFPVPDLGRYELQTIVLVQSPIETMAIRHGPNLTIVP